MEKNEKQAKHYSRIFIDNFHSGLITRFAMYEWALTLIIADFCSLRDKQDFVVHILGKFNYQKKFEIFCSVLKSAKYFDEERTSKFFLKISEVNSMRNRIAHSVWNIVSVVGDNPEGTIFEYIPYGKPEIDGIGESKKYTYFQLKKIAEDSAYIESEIMAIRAIQTKND